MSSDAFVTRVLKAVGSERCEDLWWKEEANGLLRLYIRCNDVFWWGCADAEEVVPANIEALEQAYTDADLDGAILFVARVRGMRPQGAFYHLISPENLHFFNAAGPEREIDLGNPKNEQGEYLYKRRPAPGVET